MAYRSYVLICGGTGCESGGANDILHNFQVEIESAGLKDQVQVLKTGCFGFCEQGPIVKILPEEAFYVQVKASDVKELVGEHLVKGRVVERLLYHADKDPKRAKTGLDAIEAHRVYVAVGIGPIEGHGRRVGDEECAPIGQVG